jgi:hypothetical protein
MVGPSKTVACMGLISPTTRLRLDRAALLAFVLITLAFVALALRPALHMVSVNYNEGWSAYHVRNMLDGLGLYWPADAWIVNNYPPLSFLIVGAIARLGFDPLMAQRALSVAAFAACTLFVGLIILRTERDRFAAIAAATCLAATITVNFEGALGQADPNMLAEAVMLAGLWCLLRRPDAASAQIGAALVMGVALLIKHNIITLPVSVALWLLVHDRRAALRFAVTGLLVGASGLGVSGLVYGRDFWTSMTTPRPWLLVSGIQRAMLFLPPLKSFALFGLLAAVIPAGRGARLFALNMAIAAPLAVVQLLGRGTGTNILYEITVAGALCVGVVVARLPALIGGRWARLALVAGIGFTAWFSPEVTRFHKMLGSADLARQISETAAAVDVLRAVGEPVLCEKLVLCYWAGRMEVIEPFNYGQKVLTGHMDQAPLVQRIAAGEFQAIAMEGSADSHRASLYFAPVWDAVLARYRQLPGDFGKTSVFVPR